MALRPNLTDEKGYALIEGLLSFGLFAVAASLCLSLIYILIVQMWLIYQAHLGLICVAQGKAQPICKNELRNHSTVVLKFGKIQSIQFYGDPKNRQGVILNWHIQNHSFLIHQTVDWPKVWRKKVL